MNFTISETLKKYRTLNNLSQAEVAKHLGISASAYNHYENGNREPNIDILSKLAKFYNLEDQILDVHKSNTSTPNSSENHLNAYSLMDLLNQIENNIKNRFSDTPNSTSSFHSKNKITEYENNIIIPSACDNNANRNKRLKQTDDNIKCSSINPLQEKNNDNINNGFQINIKPSKKYLLKSKQANKKMNLYSTQFDALCDYFSHYEDSENWESKNELFKDIASSTSDNDGKVYEALVYAWLEKHGILFDSQIDINGKECLNPNGYRADGIIEETVIFDVKRFGITDPNIDRLNNKLNKLAKSNYPDYYITIGGSIDISNNDIQKRLTYYQALFNDIFQEKNKIFTDYLFKDPISGLEIRANYIKNERIITTIKEFDPYKWAKENQYYFFHDASQFCLNRPFVIICPYDYSVTKQFTHGFSDSTLTAFRSICRRMFLGMSSDIYVKNYDNKCPELVSIKSASHCISAVIFQDISMNSDNDDTWIFFNPLAKNPFPLHIADKFRFHMQSMFDDFRYDTY